MGEPVVDAVGEGLRILLREHAAAVQGKLGGAAVSALGNDGNGTLLHGFHDGEAFYLDGGAVDAQVGLGSKLAQAVTVFEAENGIVGQYALFVEFVGHALDSSG